MFAYVFRRIIATIPVMAVVALAVFSLLYIAPGDPAAVIAGDQASPADIERIRQNLGLDRPFLVRFGEWTWQIAHGDLGTSIFTNLPVTTMISQRGDSTVSLPDRLDLHEQLMAGQLEAIRAMNKALKPLYAALHDGQKKIADQLFWGPMGMM